MFAGVDGYYRLGAEEEGLKYLSIRGLNSPKKFNLNMTK